jgi:hypothetical protein
MSPFLIVKQTHLSSFQFLNSAHQEILHSDYPLQTKYVSPVKIIIHNITLNPTAVQNKRDFCSLLAQ